MEQFQLNPEQKERLAGQVEDVAMAAADLSLEKGREGDALAYLKNLKTKLEKIKDASDPEYLKYRLELRQEIARKHGANYVSGFSEGFARMHIGESDWFFVNEAEEKVFAAKKFNEIQGFSEGLAAVRENLDNYFINTAGERVFPLSSNNLQDNLYEVKSFSEGLAAVHSLKGWFYINKEGKEAFPGQYFETAESFKHGHAVVSKNGIYILIDKTGKKIGEEIDIMDFTKNLLVLKLGAFYGFINWKGERMSRGQGFEESFFEDFGKFSEGLIAVKNEGEWYYVNEQGKDVFKGQRFKAADDFKDGLALVEVKSGEKNFINKKGKMLFAENKSSSLLNMGDGVVLEQGFIKGQQYRLFFDIKARPVFDQKK